MSLVVNINESTYFIQKCMFTRYDIRTMVPSLDKRTKELLFTTCMSIQGWKYRGKDFA